MINLGTYLKIHEDLPIYDKKVKTMRNVAQQLESMGSTAANDHSTESAGFATELETLNTSLFDISHNQWRRHLRITHEQQSLSLPVMALKADKLSFAMTTADLHIWKDAYRAYHKTSNFGRYNITLWRSGRHTRPTRACSISNHAQHRLHKWVSKTFVGPGKGTAKVSTRPSKWRSVGVSKLKRL